MRSCQQSAAVISLPPGIYSVETYLWLALHRARVSLAIRLEESITESSKPCCPLRTSGGKGRCFCPFDRYVSSTYYSRGNVIAYPSDLQHSSGFFSSISRTSFKDCAIPGLSFCKSISTRTNSIMTPSTAAPIT
jgi:hypothetical protein